MVYYVKETTQERSDREAIHHDNITMEKLRNVIQKMCYGTAPGHDDSAAEMLKTLSDMGCETLLNLLNHIEKKISKDWKIEITYPNYKNGDSQQSVNK